MRACGSSLRPRPRRRRWMSPTARPKRFRCPPAKRCRSKSRSAPSGSTAGTNPTSKSSSNAARPRRRSWRACRSSSKTLPAKVSIRALQTDNTTDPALRADVTVRVPRNAVIDRVQVLEGRIAIEGFSGSLTADIRRGPIDGKDTVGNVAARGRHWIGHAHRRALEFERTAATAIVQRRRAPDAGRAARRRAHHGARAERSRSRRTFR